MKISSAAILFSGFALSLACSATGALASDCETNYGIAGSSFTNTTGWLDLGNVTFPGKKNKCKNKAIANCSRAEVKNLIKQYAPVGSANFQSLCAKGSIQIYFDSQVEGKRFSKDGTCTVAISFHRAPCPPYDAYSSLDLKAGVRLAVESRPMSRRDCRA